jgi:leader peptidase (prepilin peptidase) / N-methyltransferase
MIAWLFVAAILTGWLTGGLANWAADTLPAWGKVADARVDLRTLPRYWALGRWGGGAALEHPRRVLLLNLIMVAAFVGTALLFQARPWLLLVVWLYVAFLLTVLVIDLEHRRVLNIMVGPAALVVFALSLAPGTPDPLNALLGGAVGFGSFLILAIIGRGALGFGDVKLAGLIGLMTGYPHVITALVLGVVFGGVAAVALLLSRRATRKSYMAYAPYMAVGAILVILIVMRGA